MDPPLVNEASFTASANPSSYSLAGLLSFPVTGGCGSAEESTVTEQKSGCGKRKRDFLGDSSPGSSSKILLNSASLVPRDSMNEPNIKRIQDPKSRDEARGLKAEADAISRTSSKPMEEKNKPEPPKDYIHVRARRGQATDSHSLAERARREKISERMKILQDLVPGCNKVIGKALVLDEIINYIQSLQRQVEFLSMKLEAVNSRLSPTLQGFPSKDLTNVAFDANPMLCAPQTPREYTQRAQAEWLHMQVGSTFQ